MAGRVGRSNGIGEMKETNVSMSGTVTDVDRGSVRVQLDNGHLVKPRLWAVSVNTAFTSLPAIGFLSK